MKRLKISRIRSNRTYDVKMVCSLLERSRQTVLRWLKEGLPRIDGSRPFLIHGKELRIFLENRRDKHRKTLAPGEFYCVCCHTPSQAVEGSIKLESTRIRVGKGTSQVIIHGICGVCGKKMTRFSTERRVKDDISSSSTEG